MRVAPAALLVTLLAAGCAPATGISDPRSAPLSRPQAAADCGPPAGALAPQRLEQVTRIAGARPAWVVDRADMLSAATERDLARRSQALEAATTDQVVVVTVPELRGLSIEDFGLTLGNGWGVGQAESDNGVLLLVALAERRVRIEVGCGLEAVLTDARAASIIDDMNQLFRRWEYDKAVRVGFAGIEKVLRSRLGRHRGR